MKVAVIGAGISGLATAYFLSTEHEVTVYESEKEFGGHAHTIDLTFGRQRVPVDTGFMVFNPPQYPNLTKFFRELGMQTMQTQMSFAVSVEQGFEYAGTVPRGLFADAQNLLRPKFYAHLVEIHRFNTVARRELKRGIPPSQTLATFLRKHGFSSQFAANYLVPMVGSIWSTPAKKATVFPAVALLTFLNNHHLLQEVGQDVWQTVCGGSREYVRTVCAVLKKRGVRLVAGAPVRGVRRVGKGVSVVVRGRKVVFDAVVMATHADISCTLVTDLTKREHAILSAFQYEKNAVIVHADETLMPERRAAWSAWNYLARGDKPGDPVCLTYWMNVLQKLKTPRPVFITLNPYRTPSKEKTYARFKYSHPLYTPASHRARAKLGAIQGRGGVYYCGAYFGYGFHEDGITSALAVAKLLNIKQPFQA